MEKRGTKPLSRFEKVVVRKGLRVPKRPFIRNTAKLPQHRALADA